MQIHTKEQKKNGRGEKKEQKNGCQSNTRESNRLCKVCVINAAAGYRSISQPINSKYWLNTLFWKRVALLPMSDGKITDNVSCEFYFTFFSNKIIARHAMIKHRAPQHLLRRRKKLVWSLWFTYWTSNMDSFLLNSPLCYATDWKVNEREREREKEWRDFYWHFLKPNCLIQFWWMHQIEKHKFCPIQLTVWLVEQPTRVVLA